MAISPSTLQTREELTIKLIWFFSSHPCMLHITIVCIQYTPGAWENRLLSQCMVHNHLCFISYIISTLHMHIYGRLMNNCESFCHFSNN